MRTIPRLSTLITQVKSDLEAEFGETISPFGKGVLRVVSKVWGGLLWLAYKFIGFVQRNVFVDTADPESAGGTLERWGRIKLNRNPFPAVAGEYIVVVTGTVGAIINAKTVFKADDTSSAPGMLFILDESFQLDLSTDTMTLRAIKAGAESRLIPGDILRSTIPITNVNTGVSVSSEVIEPRAAETTEDYRNVIIDAFRLEPQGGAPSDYRIWSADAQGVLRVYPYAKDAAPYEVDLYVEATEVDSTDGKGTPSAALLLEVEEVVNFDPDTTRPLNERGRRQLGVWHINYLPITPLDIDIDVADFEGITPDILSAITTVIETEIKKIRPFVAGTDPLFLKNDILNTNKIVSMIFSVVPGAVFGAVTMEVDGNPLSTYTFENGDIPYLNSVTIP